MVAFQAAASSALTDVSREVRDKQRRQKAREQLLRLNQKRREERVNECDGVECDVECDGVDVMVGRVTLSYIRVVPRTEC